MIDLYYINITYIHIFQLSYLVIWFQYYIVFGAVNLIIIRSIMTILDSIKNVKFLLQFPSSSLIMEFVIELFNLYLNNKYSNNFTDGA